jgi:hypothetical protein
MTIVVLCRTSGAHCHTEMPDLTGLNREVDPVSGYQAHCHTEMPDLTSPLGWRFRKGSLSARAPKPAISSVVIPDI